MARERLKRAYDDEGDAATRRGGWVAERTQGGLTMAAAARIFAPFEPIASIAGRAVDEQRFA